MAIRPMIEVIAILTEDGERQGAARDRLDPVLVLQDQCCGSDDRNPPHSSPTPVATNTVEASLSRLMMEAAD